MGVVTKVLKLKRNNGRDYYILYIPKSVYELIGSPAGFEFKLEEGKLVLEPLNEAEYEERKGNAKKVEKERKKITRGVRA